MTKQKKDVKAKPLEVKEVGIKIPLEKFSGVYTNVAVIHHSKNEFIMDFIFDMTGNANLVSRVITNPAHMKKFYEVLGKNLENYESRFGKIIIEENV